MREIRIYNYDAELVEDNNVRTIINIYDKDNDRRLYVIIIPKELGMLPDTDINCIFEDVDGNREAECDNLTFYEGTDIDWYIRLWGRDIITLAKDLFDIK